MNNIIYVESNIVTLVILNNQHKHERIEDDEFLFNIDNNYSSLTEINQNDKENDLMKKVNINDFKHNHKILIYLYATII